MQLPRLARIYVWVVISLGAASVAYFSSKISVDRETLIVSLLFIIAIGLYDIFATLIPEFRSDISASVALVVAGSLTLGGAWGVLIATIGTLFSEIYLRMMQINQQKGKTSVVYVVAFNTAQIAVASSILAIYLQWVHYPGELRALADFVKAFGGFFVFIFSNSTLVSGVVSLATHQPFRYLAAEWFRDFSIQYLVLCISALLLVVLYSITPWHMLLGLTPLVLVHLSFRSYLRIREEAQKTFEKVVKLLEERDPYTGEHSGEVADLAGEIAQELGLRGSEVEMIKAVARVHDIGKIAVPDRILLKPGKLDPEEWEIMKRHTEIGADLLKGLEVYGRYADVVRYEHEHWDGTGYPNGLQGEEIPIAARIIAAADVYHALISDRPYRPAYSHEEALDIIRNMAGRVLDPKVVGALLRVLERWKAEKPGEKE